MLESQAQVIDNLRKMLSSENKEKSGNAPDEVNDETEASIDKILKYNSFT